MLVDGLKIGGRDHARAVIPLVRFRSLQGPAITEIDSPLRWTAFVFVPEILAGGRGLPILGAKIRTLGSRAGLAAAIGAAGASEQVVLEKRAGSLA
jgi:hypothetical protein